MSVYNFWDKSTTEAKMKSSLSSEWDFDAPVAIPKSPASSICSRVGEVIFSDYIDIVNSKSSLSAHINQQEPAERPFDFFDDEEFAFGINLLNKNVACVGDNITKLIQMAQEPWPENVKLYQPYEVEQILLPDNASCLAVQAFLKMCNLPFEVEMRWNAEYMSPSGRVPFIKCGAFVVSELEPIVQFAANKGVTLCSRLSTEEKAEMRAYMSLITNVLLNAELYISWIDNDTFNAVTKVRNSSVYPWPLGWIQTRSKRNQVAKRLKALHWYDKTLDQVLADVEQCCNSLSQRLGDKDYFFGTPTPLDALIYGHIRGLLSATGPKAAEIIKPITSSLLRHMLRMTHLTGMKLTPPEEELVGVACRVLRHRSPDRASERSAKTRRSKGSMTVRNASNYSLSKKEMFGFKPFASKQILVATTPEGSITCEYIGDRPKTCVPISEERTNFILEIIEDVLDKVEEFVFDGFAEKIELDNEKHDFEVIAFTNHDMDSKYGSVDLKLDDLYEEPDMTNTTGSLDGGIEDILNIINDDEDIDSDGLINEKLLAAAEVPELLVEGEGSFLQKPCFSPDFTDSSNYVHHEDFITTVTSSGDQSIRKSASPEPDDRMSVKSVNSVKSVPSSVKSTRTVKSAVSFKSKQSAESDATLKFPTDSEISIESLLRYLRKRNAAYRNIPDIADLD